MFLFYTHTSLHYGSSSSSTASFSGVVIVGEFPRGGDAAMECLAIDTLYHCLEYKCDTARLDDRRDYFVCDLWLNVVGVDLHENVGLAKDVWLRLGHGDQRIQMTKRKDVAIVRHD